MTEIIMETKDINELMDVMESLIKRVQNIEATVDINLTTISENNKALEWLLLRIEGLEQQVKALRINKTIN